MHRLALFLSLIALASAAEPSDRRSEDVTLYPRDSVRVTVQGEPDVTVERQIDPSGQVNVPLVGAVPIAGLTIAEAQAAIAGRYIGEEIFIHPEVVVTVTAFAPKEVTILGQVGKQGKVSFPADTTRLSVVEAIADAGGLSRIAKGDAVRVTRHDAAGAEQIFTINVDQMIEGRGSAQTIFYLQPGDIVFVPESVF